MNGSLRFSKRAQDCYEHLQSSPQDSPSQLRVSQSPGFIQKRRVRINVRGFQFETFQATLEQFPETMLGCPTRRIEFYDPVRDQYCLDRDPAVFDFILFFYQSNGILACPETISKDAFNEELKFFGITEQDKGDKNSSSTANESLTLSNQKAETLAMEIGRHENDLNPNCTQRAQTMRAKWWLMMEYPRMSLAGAIWGKISITVILLSVFAFCLETMPELNCPKDIINIASREANQPTPNKTLNPINNKSFGMAVNGTIQTNLQNCYAAQIWFVVETTVVLFFLIEYLMRICIAPSRCKFVLSFFGIVDVAAIAPYFITLAVYGWRTEMNLQVTSFSVLRIIRLCRVLRVFKLSRYSDGLKLVGKTFSETWRTLSSLMMCVLLAVILFSSFLYYFEETEAISSIVENFYWAFITMTTVGYGDIVPKTLLGKLTASACMFFGIVLLLILPLPVFVTHFNSLYEEQVDKKRQNRQRGAFETPTILEKLMAKH